MCYPLAALRLFWCSCVFARVRKRMRSVASIMASMTCALLCCLAALSGILHVGGRARHERPGHTAFTGRPASPPRRAVLATMLMLRAVFDIAVGWRLDGSVPASRDVAEIARLRPENDVLRQ